MPHLIEVDRLTKIYQLGEVQVHALRGINVQIDTGEFVAIMGPSGSGKSTFMNILGCLDQPTTGKYRLDGTDVSQLTRNALAEIRNKRIGFVFQQFNLLSRTTALENVELPLLYNGTTNKERYDRAMHALEIVGLHERAYHYPNQLSGGQQQRVAIARALVNSPSIILADEPTGNLDSRTSIEIMGIFQKLNSQNHITIVIVTHERDIAQYAQRVVYFKDGKIKYDKPVDEHLDAVTVLEQMPASTDDEMELPVSNR
ncbi:MAG: ABC transporter ATP-binding protein [bacterium]|nr:ABC transporter ATP-binding protein [bacterium]